jgi:hypothetical protein
LGNFGIGKFRNLVANASISQFPNSKISKYSYLTVRDLAPGLHLVRVYGDKPLNSNKRVLLYSRNLQVKPKYFIDFIINRFSKVFIDEQIMKGIFRDNNSSNNDRPDDNAYRAMSDQNFLSFKETIKKEGFDASKTTIAKQVIDQNWFYAEQASQLVQLFTFDKTRLEIAKYIYGRTLDKKNFFIIYNIFDFSQSKDELAAYIRNYR